MIRRLVLLPPFALLPLLSLALPLAARPLAAQQPLCDEFPDDWFWHRTEAQRARHRELIGRPMPALDLDGWHGGAVDLRRDLTGKVVVVEFWATWCAWCLRTVPDNNAIAARFAGRDLVFFGVCGSAQGQERMAGVATEKGMRYPVARDPREASGKAWRVQFWPTYAVVDRAGTLRAIGLKPEFVDDVADRLLAETAGAAAARRLPADLTRHREPREGGRADVDALEGKPPPPLHVDGWRRTPAPLRFEALRGKVVLVRFFTTWDEASREDVPRVRELLLRHRDHGLVAIGVCATEGAADLVAFAARHGIDWPIARDVEDRTVAAWHVDESCDSYLIDRRGALRIADCNDADVANVIETLLAEPAPPAREDAREPPRK